LAHGYCGAHRKRGGGKYAFTCPECGREFTANTPDRVYCSRPCLAASKLSPMQRAVRSGDPAAVLAVVPVCTRPAPGGCLEWRFALNTAGYPVIGQGASGGLVHRHVLAASLGITVRALNREPVHHKCANPPCINPEHLQQVSQHDNVAEMLHRQFYIGRIAALEAALRDVAPAHPLLVG